VIRDVELFGQRHQLIDRGGPVGIPGDQPGAAPIATQHQRQLGRGGRLARALQPDQHDHARRRPAQVQAAGLAQRIDQFFVDDLDHLLGRFQALLDLGTNRALFHAVDEVLGDLQVDVGLQQRHAHFAQRGRDVFLGQLAFTP